MLKQNALRIGLGLYLALLVSPLAAQRYNPHMDPDHEEGNMASTYVPIESWIYPAIDRLAALGYVHTSVSSLRPWTRMECARLVSEAGYVIARDSSSDPDAVELQSALAAEFTDEILRRGDQANNGGAYLESFYLRNTAIAGTPITDGYHFAQTQVNDYGRPYGPGENLYAGVAVRGLSGPFAIYARAEMQSAGLEPGPLPSSLPLIAAADDSTGAAAGPVSGTARGRLLDAYASVNFKNNQISIGQQTLWWGPTQSGPFLSSNNAEPVLMIRYDRTEPFVLPSIFRLLGHIRGQFFLGRLAGQQFVVSPANVVIGQSGIALGDQPFLHGEKVSFKFTENFEFSISRTTIFAGPGRPFTLGRLKTSLFSLSTQGGAVDPGDRRAASDFSYRIPGLRDWITLYADAFTEDQYWPIAYPKDSAWSPGIFLPKLPNLHQLSLRAEGVFTPPRIFTPGYYYWNDTYQSGYTNNRQLIGSWIGREGRGEQVWATWSSNPRSSLQASYRNMSVNHSFLQGGNLHDLSLAGDFALTSDWTIHTAAQYERWYFPLYAASPTTDFSVTVQVTYSPTNGLHWNR